MTDEAFTRTMIYANWTEPNIRCELFLRQLRVPPFRVAAMELLRDLLWFLIGFALLVGFWAAVGYGIYKLVT